MDCDVSRTREEEVLRETKRRRRCSLSVRAVKRADTNSRRIRYDLGDVEHTTRVVGTAEWCTHDAERGPARRAGLGAVRPSGAVARTPVSVVSDRVPGLHDRGDPRRCGSRGPHRPGGGEPAAVYGDGG